jgi:signal transduction histidine kinase
VHIEMLSRDDELGLVLANTVERGDSGQMGEFSNRLGLPSVSRRLEGVGGRIAVTSTPGSWSIDLAVPVEINRDEGNV